MVASRASCAADYSTLTGSKETSGFTAEYWGRQMRGAVRFLDATRALLGEFDLCLELSPHPVLSPAMEETAGAEGKTVGAVPTLRRHLHDARMCALGDWGSHFCISSGLAKIFPLIRMVNTRLRVWCPFPVTRGRGNATGLMFSSQEDGAHRSFGSTKLRSTL